MRALLDINVLLALFDAGHQHHARARQWMAEHIVDGWASCPLTQNGFIRVVSQRGYPNHVSPAQAIERLTEATLSPYHAFWPDDVSITDTEIFDRPRIHGPRQLTDVYLLALAVHNRGRFITFDETVAHTSVHHARKHHLVVL